MEAGTALPVRSCVHPEWLGPGPKPPPAQVRYLCACGANWACPVCRYGAGAMPCRCDRQRMEEAAQASMSDSAFDRPVTHLAIAANPWPHAKQLMEHGCEVMDCDFIPDGKLYLIDLAALDLPDLPPDSSYR